MITWVRALDQRLYLGSDSFNYSPPRSSRRWTEELS